MFILFWGGTPLPFVGHKVKKKEYKIYLNIKGRSRRKTITVNNVATEIQILMQYYYVIILKLARKIKR